MKITRIISKLRAFVQIVALAVIALASLFWVLPQYSLQNLVQSLWPYGAVVILLYAVFTLSGDYANNRILRPRC